MPLAVDASSLSNPTPHPRHPYLSGNFAPIHQTRSLTSCSYTGRIPAELADGQYVRNGSNPVSNDDLGRAAHWFDGDGMLSGVLFAANASTRDITPAFVNQFVLTDLYLSALSSPRLRIPILPSIATLVNPLLSLWWVAVCICRTLLLVLLSHLPGSHQPIKRISVANTHVVYHDGRALATCESGPPMRIQLPGLETVGWYNGADAEGESRRPAESKSNVLGQNDGLLGFMREWTTAHPKVDPQTNEMIMFHSSFAPPYVQYSIIPQSHANLTVPRMDKSTPTKLLNASVPGVSSAKMMHDFGVSSRHTVIMDLPLSLDPLNQLKGLPPVAYDSSKPSRFGVFPRRSPHLVQWFETDASCIFHTANTWDEHSMYGEGNAVNMLACRLTSATLVFAAGNIAPPVEKRGRAMSLARSRISFYAKYDSEVEQTIFEKSALLEDMSDEKDASIRVATPEHMDDSCEADFCEEQCRLYYYHFDLPTNNIRHQWALTAIPFEFPSVRADLEMQPARYIYGCSTTSSSFNSALGKATKIDALVKVDAETLIRRGRAHPPRSVSGVVDARTVDEVLASTDEHDPIRIFRMPEGWYAQEPRFVPAAAATLEDQGYLLFYAFDETQLQPDGSVPCDTAATRATSELWVIDARNMRDIIARIHLPQRVPYGLHGTWFSRDQIQGQRPTERVRTTDRALQQRQDSSWNVIRDFVEQLLG